jgi:hypothetical protein
MKEHNGDYLSNETLEWHPRLGIHACNVAPEFGVIETRELVALLENNGLSSLAEDFINLAYSSRKCSGWHSLPLFERVGRSPVAAATTSQIFLVHSQQCLHAEA